MPSGSKPLPQPMLTQNNTSTCVTQNGVRLYTICGVTRPQWAKTCTFKWPTLKHIRNGSPPKRINWNRRTDKSQSYGFMMSKTPWNTWLMLSTPIARHSTPNNATWLPGNQHPHGTWMPMRCLLEMAIVSKINSLGPELFAGNTIS